MYSVPNCRFRAAISQCCTTLERANQADFSKNPTDRVTALRDLRLQRCEVVSRNGGCGGGGGDDAGGEQEGAVVVVVVVSTIIVIAAAILVAGW